MGDAEEEVLSAVERAKADPNKVRHIFHQAKHGWNMTGLSQQGNWKLIQNTLQKNYEQLPNYGSYEVTQHFGSYTITVAGAIVNGAIRIGSAWINAI